MKGRLNHHSLCAFVVGLPIVLHAWVRLENTAPSRGQTKFLLNSTFQKLLPWFEGLFARIEGVHPLDRSESKFLMQNPV